MAVIMREGVYCGAFIVQLSAHTHTHMHPDRHTHTHTHIQTHRNTHIHSHRDTHTHPATPHLWPVFHQIPLSYAQASRDSLGYLEQFFLLQPGCQPTLELYQQCQCKGSPILEMSLGFLSWFSFLAVSLQAAGDRSHKPGSRLPSLSTRPWLPPPLPSLTAHWPVPNYTAWWQRHMCERTCPGLHSAARRPEFEPATCWLQVQPLTSQPSSVTVLGAEFILIHLCTKMYKLCYMFCRTVYCWLVLSCLRLLQCHMPSRHFIFTHWLDVLVFTARACVSVVFAVARCLSVCLSVTLVDCIHTAVDIVKPLCRTGRLIILVFWPSSADTQFQGNPFSGDAKYKGWSNFAIFDWNLRLSWKWYEIGPSLLWNVNRKSYAMYRMVTFSMTLTDP